MNRPSVRLEPDHNSGARFTMAEFLRMGEAGAFDDMRVELIEGELERMNPPMGSHSRRQTTVMMRLGAVVGDGKLRVDSASG